MPTINQLTNSIRQRRIRKNRVKPLQKCPQKRGICVKVYTTSPKKPNSAVRKIAKVRLVNKRMILVNIPGQGHKLQEYSVVLVRGGRVRDMPGIRFRLVRGCFDFNTPETFVRKNGRSKYGIEKLKT